MKNAEYLRNNFRITPNSEQVPIQVVGSSTFGRYDKIASGLTYNMFISDGWLVNFPGYKKTIQFLSEGEGRGLFYSTRGNIVIAVANANVFRIESDLSYTAIGALSTSSGEVFIDENLNNQICIVDGSFAYIYNYLHPDQGVVVQDIQIALKPNYVCFHNGFFLFGNAIDYETSGAAWYAFVPDSATTIKEETQLTLSTKPDYAIAVRRLPGQGGNILVFGRTVCEIWTHIGGLQNYRRNSSINIDYGCMSVSTIASCDQFTVWLAINENNSPIILVYSSEGIRRISTDGIDYLLSHLKFPGQSTALFFTQDGHLFYQLTFYSPADDLTLIYDFNTEKFFNLSDHDGKFHPARDMVYFNNEPYFISIKNACLYKSDTSITVYNENVGSDGATWDKNLVYPIARTRVCESIRKPDSGRFVINSFVFTMAQGDDPNFTELSLEREHQIDLVSQNNFNLVSEEGFQMISEKSTDKTQTINHYENPSSLIYRPRVDMAISKDSGVTWSNYVSRELNPIGKRKNIITYNNLGSANEFNIKLRWWGLGNVIANDGFVELY